MNLSFKYYCFLAFLTATPSLASQVSTQSRSYTHSCGYYSTAHADAIITYKNDSLPWGVKVELIGGVEGYRSYGGGRAAFIWRKQQTRLMPAVGPYEWRSSFSLLVTERSSDEFVNGFDFYFRITFPDGHIEYDKGTSERTGYYQVSFDNNPRPCVDGPNGEKPEFQLTHVTVVRG